MKLDLVGNIILFLNICFFFRMWLEQNLALTLSVIWWTLIDLKACKILKRHQFIQIWFNLDCFEVLITEKKINIPSAQRANFH